MAGPYGIPQKIQSIDLEPIIVKIINSDGGEGWSLEFAQDVEMWYRRFLALVLKYPSWQLAPPKVVDTFWHYHILDTEKYAEDCQEALGRFLHHFPYFGMRSSEDQRALQQAFQMTQSIYEAEFGESPAYLSNSAGLCGPANCDASCGSTDCAPDAIELASGSAAGQDRSRPNLASLGLA
jgi:hypothetical protein